MTYKIRSVFLSMFMSASVFGSCSTAHDSPRGFSWSLEKQFESFSGMQFSDKYLSYLANARTDKQYEKKANSIIKLQESAEHWLLVQNINVEYRKSEIEFYFKKGSVWNKYRGLQDNTRVFSDSESEEIDKMISQLHYERAESQTALCETFISHPDITFITIRKIETAYNFTSVGDIRSDCYNVDVMKVAERFGSF